MRGLSASPDRRSSSASASSRPSRPKWPGSLALLHTEIYLPVRVARLQKYSPAIFRHAHVSELRPTVGFDARRGAQIDFECVTFAGAHVIPPIHVGRLPVFERSLQHAVPSEVHVIWNFFGVVNHGDLLSLKSKIIDRKLNSFPF